MRSSSKLKSERQKERSRREMKKKVSPKILGLGRLTRLNTMRACWGLKSKDTSGDNGRETEELGTFVSSRAGTNHLARARVRSCDMILRKVKREQGGESEALKDNTPNLSAKEEGCTSSLKNKPTV